MATAARLRPAYPRAMLKISGEAFAGDRGAGGGIDFGFIDRLVNELKTEEAPAPAPAPAESSGGSDG